MPDVLEQHTRHEHESGHGDLAACRSLLAQIEHLERELAALASSSWPRTGVVPVTARGPRRAAHLPGLGELERARDALVARRANARGELASRRVAERGRRALLEAMLLEPGHHRGLRITNAELGEPGCTSYEVRPRWGLLGRLAGWWRVRISSGCPLAMARIVAG